ncbi:MAG: TfoX/Sxy family protein [Trueperaceae bacterium]|nr:MAG: TfoX/Sxy family protein [Trueperaceae bacterium]
MAFDEGLAERIREIVEDWANVSERKMFGGLAFMQEGHMFVGIIDDALMARVGAEQYREALLRPHVREMDFTGRPMKGYVYVDPEGVDSDEELTSWVELASQFVSTLPPKKPT